MSDSGSRTNPSRMLLGQVFRDARPKSHRPGLIDDHVNLYAATYLAGARLVPFESGINPLARIKAPEGLRVPAILVASSPHKVGLSETPWQDQFDVDNGRIRYYGDNRTPGRDPAMTPGNKALLSAYARHVQTEPADRSQSIPLLFFRRVRHDGKAKGFARFEGVGVVTGVELVSQYSARAGGTFANFAFDFLVMDVAREAETVDWRWINSRRDPQRELADTLEHAPHSWKRWLAAGVSVTDVVRRRVSRLLVEPKASQLPRPGTPEERILDRIYDFFRQGKRHRFEALAQTVARRVISPGAESYLMGGLTRATADQGIDFIARVDIGSGFGKAKLVVLGQAKCEKPSGGTNANDIARTVARLRRGWLGVYVTTSFFTPNAQREVIEDRYPIVLIGGLRVAGEVRAMLLERGADTIAALDELLREVDDSYAPAIAPRDPEELLLQ